MLRADSQPVTPVSHVLYLHGFNSGATSLKAQLVQRACRALSAYAGDSPDVTALQLPHRPQAAMNAIETALATLGRDTLVIGSSMGGFLATCLVERHGLRGVLINPAVRPARLVSEWLGACMVNDYTGERFVIGTEHAEELEALTPHGITQPERYLVLLGSADETLDSRDALQAYAGCRTIIHPGGDHGFSALARYLPAVLAHGGHYLPVARVPGGEDATAYHG
ncbi:YqiA/YcfP family alpha/beta fold hydrolase [Halomonas sp. WWR20]